MAHELRDAGMGLKNSEEGRIQQQRHRRERPNCQQHGLASQIIADLDFLLVFVSGLIDDVVLSRLEEEVTNLPAGHGHEPANEGCNGRILESNNIAEKKAQRDPQVEGLVDPTVVVIPMVIPSLYSQGLQKTAHLIPLQLKWFVRVMAIS